MAQSIEDSLLQAIKKDDIKAFDALMEKAQCGAYRLGRFPVLSLLYLYKSRKILSAYEEMFLKTTNSVTLSEPAEISKKFSAKAGKCLRLYFNEVVSPLEMLLILDKTKHLKKVYPMTNLSSAVKERLKSIYYIRYSLSVKFEGNEIIIERRPLTYREKKRLATICLSAVLVILIVIGASVTTSIISPKRLDKYIDLSSNEEFILEHDVYVPRNYSIEEINCSIVGNGHKLIFRKGATIKTFNGKMSDLTIECSGNAIINTISQYATLENVTVNVNANVTTAKSNAFVAMTNYGSIDGIKVNVSGRLTTAKEVDGEITIGGIVYGNAGTVKNCVVNYSRFSLDGRANTSANSSFGGMVGINVGNVQGCSVTGKITADTFDVVGVCLVNNYVISDTVNKADISQTSANAGWSPIACGIVSRNYYLVKNCENLGSISATSNCGQIGADDVAPSATSAGIAYLNGVYKNGINASIEKCKNSGEISAISNGEVYIGGITATSYGYIYNSINSGNITVKAHTVYAGGILGFSQVAIDSGYIYFSTVDSCISQGKINVKSDDTAYVGGIVGQIAEMEIEQYKVDEDGNFIKDENNQYVTETVFRGGRVKNCYFTGEYTSEVKYFGNIVGACGANIYRENSYTSGTSEHRNFEDNYYLANSFSAFGATVSGDDIANAVEDKGATSATLEEILNSKAYKSIIDNFDN
ncbi:MAG: hypothetical protein K2L52_05595 [Clostridia bacterium]|nr:hypothetical protein [Clostridia bacterium]